MSNKLNTIITGVQIVCGIFFALSCRSPAHEDDIIFNQADTTAPTPGGSGKVTVSCTSGIGSLNISWAAGTDNTTAAANLQYRAYYSLSSSFSTLSQVEAGTPIGGFAVNTTSTSITGLPTHTQYYFNVVIKDAAGNKQTYSAALKATTRRLQESGAGAPNGGFGLAYYDTTTCGIKGKAVLADATARRACSTANCGGGINENIGWVLIPNQLYTKSDDTTIIMLTNSAGIFNFSTGSLSTSIGSGAASIFTGLNTDWTTGLNCSGWSSTAGGGLVGDSTSTTNASISQGGSALCNSVSQDIYCAEQ